MILKNLQLIEFRNFPRLQIEFRPRLNFFLGHNGQGKTNLLEAVHILSRGRSFRAVDSKNLISHSGAQRAFVRGHFLQDDLDYFVEVAIAAGKKTATVNHSRANSAVLLKTFPTVLFSPESLAAVKEGPEQRRQLVDELLVSHDPRQAQLLREHGRALKARNRLLKNISESRSGRLEQELSLDSLNKIYFILAAHLAHARIRALLDIQNDFQQALRFIFGESTGDISVDYLISGESAFGWSESEIYDALQKRHQALQLQEIACGSSLVGPHKHDIKFLYDGKDSRFYCSQGQQRALILALKIAQIVYHHKVHQTYPVLLLDDVLSELDVHKRVNLMRFLEGISAQVLITATDLTWSDHFELDRNSVFSVTSGDVQLLKTDLQNEGGPFQKPGDRERPAP